MKSMTGYAAKTVKLDTLSISIEIASLNKKNLETNAYIPKEWQSLEIDLLKLLRSKIHRGKVTITLRPSLSDSSGSLSWDNTQLSQVIQKLDNTSKSLNIPLNLDSNLLFAIIKTLSGASELPPADPLKDTITNETQELLDKLIEMRTAEGQFLKKDIQNRLKLLSDEVESVLNTSQNNPHDQQKLLIERLSKINPDLNCDLNDERILKEIALFADRCDICEEITRLKSHIQLFESYLETQEPIGRKMDFLCQEMNREINTIGSKTNNLDITRSTLHLKNELERIREQIQNIE